MNSLDDPAFCGTVRLSQIDEMTIESVIWRRHAAGVAAPQIAAEINKQFGKGREIVTGAAVAEWAERHERLRNSSPVTRTDAFRRVKSGVRVLRGELTIALSNFNAVHHEAGRAGAFIALQAACDFIEGYVDDDASDLTRPLRTLMLALDQADSGATHPIVAPAPRGRGGPKVDFARDVMASFGAVAMDAAMAAGWERRAAASAVAAELARLGYRKPNGQAIETATVMGWRDRANEGPDHFPAASERLREFRRALREKRDAGQAPRPDMWKKILAALGRSDRVAGIRKKS